MKLPVRFFRKAAVKKRTIVRAEESRKRPHSPTPSSARSPTSSSSPSPLVCRPRGQQGPIPAVDLTANTPPEEPRPEAAATSTDPTLPTADPVSPEAGPVAGEAPLTGCSNECPTVSPPTGETPLPDATPVAPELVEAAVGYPSEATPQPSLLADGRRAESLAAQVCLPEFKEELLRQGASSLFRDAYAVQLLVTNSLSVMRKILIRGEMALEQSQREVADLRTRVEEAERAREAAERALEGARNQVDSKANRAWVAEEKLKAAEEVISTRDLRIEALAQELKEAEQRASKAEEMAHAADTKAAEAVDAAQAAAVRASAAEQKASEAMETFRKSTDFLEELAEGCSDAYLKGFDDCKRKVSKDFGLDLESIEPEEEPEGSDREHGPAEGGSTPAED